MDILIFLNPIGIKGWNAPEAIKFTRTHTEIPYGCVSDNTIPYVLLACTSIAEEQGWWAGKTALKILSGTPQPISWQYHQFHAFDAGRRGRTRHRLLYAQFCPQKRCPGILSSSDKSQMVCLESEDNGPGMDEAMRKRVFEPFFTTKPVDVGTGLGLSVSYFIITDNHKGQMTVASTPGKGTTFYIRLPMAGRLGDA